MYAFVSLNLSLHLHIYLYVTHHIAFLQYNLAA